jgi:uncharacterized membrane protein YfcA
LATSIGALVQTADLSGAAVLILVVAAFLTAVLSAIVGMAGGITLLAVMLLFLDPLVAIPLHGVVQLVANGSRSWIQRSHVRIDIAWRYALPLIPMGFAGLALAENLPPEVLRASIGIFVLAATWAPQLLLLGARPGESQSVNRFVGVGAVAGFLNMSIGATGPLIAPFYLNLGLTRFALIGTKAACQALGHIAKVLVFGAVGFAFGDYAALLAVLAAAVVSGTWAGSRILQSVNERAFVVLYKGILTIIALRLVLVELSRLI